MNNDNTERRVSDQAKTQREALDSKRKFEELTKAVNGLRKEIASLHKKQLTEATVQLLISWAFSSRTPVAATMTQPGVSTGGYSGLFQLQEDPHAKMMLEL